MLNDKLSNTRITPQNIEKQVEQLKYSSNKMTQILLDELNAGGLEYYTPSMKSFEGFKDYTPIEAKMKVNNSRMSLNSKILMLEQLSQEAKTNPAFQGENANKNWSKAVLYITNLTSSPNEITSTLKLLKEQFGIDMGEKIEDVLNNNPEINFELKPETVEQIEKDDFSTSYDNTVILENLKKAMNVPFLTKIKNSIMGLKNKLFSRKKQLLLPSGENVERLSANSVSKIKEVKKQILN